MHYHVRYRYAGALFVAPHAYPGLGYTIAEALRVKKILQGHGYTNVVIRRCEQQHGRVLTCR